MTRQLDRPRIQRRRGACEGCKARKTKCDGISPCCACQLHNIQCLYVDRRTSLKRKATLGISQSSLRQPPLGNLELSRPPMSPAYQGTPSHAFLVPGQVQPTVPIGGFSDGYQHTGSSNEDVEMFYQNFAAVHASGNTSSYAMQQMDTAHNWGSLSYPTGTERFYALPNWNNVGQEFGCQGSQESNLSSIGADFLFERSRAQEDAPALAVLPTPITEHDTGYSVSTNRNSLSPDQQGDEGLEEMTTVTHSPSEAPAVSQEPQGTTENYPDSSAPNEPSGTTSPSLSEHDNSEIEMTDANALLKEHKENPMSSLLQLYISLDVDELYSPTTQGSTGRRYDARVSQAFKRLTATFCASLAAEAKSAAKLAQGGGNVESNPHIGDVLSSIPCQTRKAYIDACYNDLYGFCIEILVSRSDLEAWVEDTTYHSICSSPTADPCKTMTVISLLALGSLNTGSLTALDSLSTGLKYRKSSDNDIERGLGMDGTRPSSSSAKHTGLELFNLALVAYRHLGTTAHYLSSVTFKALMTMIIFAQEAGHPIMNSLLVDAALISYRLKLYSSTVVEADTQGSGSHQRMQLQGAFWLLYCLEKPFCLYSGRPSMLNDEFIDYDPPEIPSPAPLRRRDDEFQRLSDHETLRAQCEYAKICDKIAKDFFGQISLRNSTSTNTRTANQIIGLLNRWYEVNVTKSPSNTMQVDPTRRELTFLLQTCMAKFVVYGRSLQLGLRQQRQCERNLVIYDRFQNECLDSAQNLIQCILNIRFEKILFNIKDRRILNLVRTATLLIALSETKGNSSSANEELRHISNACGVFGRIASLDATVLDELIELGQFTKTMTSVISSNPS